ncbi:WbqC family protein [Desulfonema magnum]|nr:WbqC family protein [Desulfonema magnum]
MMQPTFLPWQGYFELIYKADVFIFLDDFQFSVQGYHQRNRLFINKNKADWHTVPIDKKSSFKKALNETKINENIPWRKKMWKRIKQNYGKTPYFDMIALFLEKWLLSTYNSLAEQNMIFIRYVCESFAWKRKFVLSSSYPSEKKRSEHVVELLRRCNAKQYYCAYGSFDYMLEDKVFPLDDIDVFFQNYDPRPYKQILSDNFIPYLSVLDALFNIGFDATADLIVNGTEKWMTWEDMLSLYAKEF